MVEITLGSISLECETKSDLFSPKKFDDGSRLLATYVKDLPYTSALDWGCGWGALGLILAANRPASHIICLDANVGAVAVTTQNVQRNQLKNVTVMASDSYSVLDEQTKFDLIVSHPPTHLGREIVEAMIEQARPRLIPGGNLSIVVEARLKPWVSRALQEVFGQCQIVTRTNKHVVLSVKNTL